MTEPPASPKAQHVERMTIIRCPGDLDVGTDQHLNATLAPHPQKGAGAVVVDLTDSTFVGCSSVGAFVGLAHRCQRAGVGIRVVVPPGSAIPKLWTVFKLEELLPYTEDIGQALEEALTVTDFNRIAGELVDVTSSKSVAPLHP